MRTITASYDDKPAVDDCSTILVVFVTTRSSTCSPAPHVSTTLCNSSYEIKFIWHKRAKSYFKCMTAERADQRGGKRCHGIGENNTTLERCIDDECQFKTAKRSQAPGDATVLKRVFRDNFVIFRHRSKRIAFLESVIFTCDIVKNSVFRKIYVCKFAISSDHFLAPSMGLYLPNAWSQTLQTI